jgi:hypothetical protein
VSWFTIRADTFQNGGLSIPQGQSIQIFTHNQITQPSLSRVEPESRNPRLSAKKWEITMRKTILTVVTASVIAALTAQVAAASERHRARTNGHSVATQQFRNSNAFAAPRSFAVPSGWSGYDGAMGSGTAGH